MSSVSTEGGRTRVLHVDGDASVTARIDGETESFEVVSAAEPRDALSRLEAGEVGCVVSGYDLPGMDGVEFFEAVREVDADVPFILFTGSGNEAVASRAFSAGVTDYVRKDAESEGVELLVDRVQAAVQRPLPVSAGRDESTRFGRFIEAFPDVVFVIDEAGRYADVIASGSSPLLYDEPGQLIGQRFHDVLPEETADRFLTVLEEALETGEQQRIEYHLDVQSGPRWFEARVGPLGTGGEPRTVFWIARDVTERKRREQEYEQIFNTVNDSIVVHDPETGEMVDANETFCELVGYDRETVLRRGTAGLSVQDEGFTTERAEEIIEQVMATGDVEPFEWKVETSGGEQRLLEVTATQAEIGGALRHVSLMRDITERRQREREYEQIFNSVNDAITVFDPDAGEITEVNEAYREILGYDLESIRDLGIEGLSATDEGYTGERGWELIREVADTGETRTVEWQAETNGDDRIWLEVTLTPTTIGGEQRVLSIQRDVTERRELERTYRDIFESVSDGLVVHDPETGEIIEVNERYCEVTGYDREELLGASIDIIMPDDPSYTFDDALQRIRKAREEVPQLFEFKGEQKSGDPFVGDISLNTVEIRGEERVLASVRDITERRRREREYEQIFDGVNDAIVIQDPETAEPIDANETFLDRLGYDDVDEIRAAGLEGLSAAEGGYTKRRAQELCRRVMETGEPEVVEWQQETKGGESRWIEAKVDSAVIRGEDRILSMQRDITERKRRERAIQALQEATERLQTATTREEVATVAVETASDVLDRPMAVCWFHDDDAERLVAVEATDPVHEAGLVSGLSPDRYEYEVFLDGAVTRYTPSEQSPENPLEAGVLLPLADHGLVAAASPEDARADETVLDIAKALADHVTTALDRVDREQDVRESERRFRLIAERIDEVIYLANTDFTEALYVNPAYESVWGRPVEELYEDARKFLDAVDSRDREETEARIEAMVEEMQHGDPADSYEFEYRIRQPGGEIRWVSATGYAVEMSDGERRFVGIVEDITDRKYREQRLEVFNRILRHNLRNQLDVIRSHAETLADRTDADNDHAERIITAVDALAGMGARARKTDRIMSMDDDMTEVSLSETLAEVVETVAGDGSAVEVASDLPASARLRTNRDALQTAVKSALENAIEYADSRVGVTVEEHSGEYTVVIDDDGPGIPAEELVPIEAGTETSLDHGRGLGLWQLRWGVDKLNGELSFETDAGTTILMTVPDHSEPADGG